MATWDDVRRIAMALPEVNERLSWGTPSWRVKDKMFAWDRPLRDTDLRALGDDAPAEPILGVRVADEGVKHALVADDPTVYFTIPHFNGYSAVLVQLDNIDTAELEELLTEAWALRAPKRLASAFLASRGGL